MAGETYRSLTDIADEWSRDPTTPGSRERLFRMLVAALCDGAFYKHGIAVRAHALLLAADPHGETYDPYAEGSERLPELELVPDAKALHGYFAPCIVGSLPDSIACDHEAFFDWLKNGGLERLNKNGRLAFNYIAINGGAFVAWCRDNDIEPPSMVGHWLSVDKQAPARSTQKKGDKGQSSRLTLSKKLPNPARVRILNILEDTLPPFPNQDLLSLCEAVTFLATGKARCSEILLRFMHRQGGERQPKGLWSRMEQEVHILLSSLRRGDLVAYGSLNNGPIEPIPRDYFANEVFAEFVKDLIAPDLSASNAAFGRTGVPTYKNVRFWRQDFTEVKQRYFSEIRRKSNVPAKQTIAAESRCRKWLMEQMWAGPQRFVKAEYEKQATKDFGTGPSQFKRAWAMARSAVRNTEWGKPGRRAKTDGSS